MTPASVEALRSMREIADLLADDDMRACALRLRYCARVLEAELQAQPVKEPEE